MENEARLTIRLPGKLKTWLERVKEAEGSTVNYEIIRSIRERMERSAATTGEGLQASTPAVAHDSAALPGGA